MKVKLLIVLAVLAVGGWQAYKLRQRLAEEDFFAQWAQEKED